MKTIAMLFVVGLLASCGGSGGGSVNTPPGNDSTIQGQNLTGVWRFSSVECYDNNLSLTSYYTLGAGNPVSDWSINGNSTTSSTLNSSTCRTDITRNIVFTPNTTTSTYTYGTLAAGAGTASIPTGQGSCSYNYTLTKVSGGDINPTSISATYTNGQSLAASNGEYVHFQTLSPNALAIPSIIQVVGAPTNVCFLVYIKVA